MFFLVPGDQMKGSPDVTRELSVSESFGAGGRDLFVHIDKEGAKSGAGGQISFYPKQG